MKNIVGFENLPNAFIKRINIYNSEKAKSYVTMIEMCIKDHKMDNGQWSWYDDEILKDNLSILCVLCYNVDIIQDIRNGQLTLSPKDLTNHPSYVSGDIKIKSIPIKIKKFKKEMAPGLHSLSYRVRFDIDREAFDRNGGDVVIFAASYVEFTKMANNVGGTVPLDYSVFHGPIQSDYILESGVPPETSTIYSNAGLLYVGPTHEHEGQIMAGSKHSAAPHPVLEEIAVENLKIKDYTKFNDVSIKQEKNMYFKNYFSSLYYCGNESHTTNSVFFINIALILATKSRFGRMIANHNMDLFRFISQTSKISNLTIKRHRVMPRVQRRGLTKVVGHGKILKTEEMISTKDNEDTGRIIHRVKLRNKYSRGATSFVEANYSDMEKETFSVPSSNSSPNVKYLKNYVPYFGISDLQASSSPADGPSQATIRGIQMSDPSLSMNDDSYSKYSVIFKMIDPTIIFVRNAIEQMKEDLDSLKTHVSRLTSEKYYDSEMDKVKIEMENIETLSDLEPANVTDRYVRMSSLLSLMDDLDEYTARKKMLGYIKMDSLTKKSGNEYIKKYRNMYNKFIQKFNVRNINNKTQKSIKKQKVYQLKSLPTICIENTFEEIINYKNYKYAYEYYRPKNSVSKLGGILRISEQQFVERMGHESSKNGGYVLNDDFFKDLPKNQSDALIDVVGLKKSYLTPENIITPEERIKVDVTSTVSSEKINNLFTRVNISAINKKTVKSNLISKTSFVRNSISNNNRKFLMTPPIFKRYTFKSSTNNEKDQKDIDFIESFNYLGNNSPFITEVLDRKTNKPKLVEDDFKKVTNKLMVNFNLRKGPMVTMKNFNLKSEDNVFVNKKNNNVFADKLRRMPYQTKVLFKKPLPDETFDILGLPESSAILNIKHFAVQKISYLSGFQQSREGMPLLKKPMWEIMQEDALRSIGVSFLCKMTQYEDRSVGAALAENMKLNIHNSLFVIHKMNQAGGDTMTPLPTMEMVSSFTEYMTTNPIKQSPKRDMINSRYEYSIDARITSNIDIEDATPIVLGQPTTTATPESSDMSTATTPSTGGGMGGGMSSGMGGGMGGGYSGGGGGGTSGGY